jgi:tetratricopeptide (TPR) repeat protein
MAFGFGFNKQKVLSAAEKFVQQGKLQNAIAEYEKILKNDAKDLTVANTVGDLYARLGESEKAVECFKAVGDAYASQGFTVKAIAMYKKITKIKTSLESVLKLAELYTQQGLFNDARAQYLQVAEEFLRSGELEQAVRIFQKILEMDPENVAMRVRLAEVYIRLGKKNDAWQIFSAAAESLRARGQLNAAEEILQRMISLDPGNGYALLLRGRNAAESGDFEAAIKYLEKVADLDSHPDGLRDLLKAYLQAGRLPDATTLAGKLLTVHNDTEGIFSICDALMLAGQYHEALRIYSEHSERLLSSNSAKVLEHLHSIIGHVRGNTDALNTLLELFQKAGESTHVNEVTELLAHAYVQSGQLPKARDLYQSLAVLEPQNQLHIKNYEQVVAMLGGTTGSRLITAEEGAVMVDELEATAPFVEQHYADAVALAVRSALTDADLFVSYNMPAKALVPLMAVLPQAPRDLRLNQRLAALHTRAERFAEAAVCCRNLEGLYSEAGYPDEAVRYGELAGKYEERASAGVNAAVAQAVATPPVPAAPWPVDAPFKAVSAPPVEPAEFEVQEAVPEAAAEFEVEETPQESTEFDISAEWEGEVGVGPVSNVAPAQPAASAAPPPKQAPGDAQTIAETVQEIRFYLAHYMTDQARVTFSKLEKLTQSVPLLANIRAELQAAEAQAQPPEPEVVEAEAESVEEIDVPPQPAPALEQEAQPEPEIAAEAAAAQTEQGVLDEFVSDLEASLGDGFLPETVATEIPAPAAQPEAEVEPEPVAEVEPAAAPAHQKHGVLGEFVSDLESSLGEGFLAEAPVPEPEPEVHAAVHAEPEAEPAVAQAEIAMAARAAAAAPASIPAPVAAAAAAMVPSAAPTPAAPPSLTYRPAKMRNLGESPAKFSAAGVDLADMFGELKHELEEDVATTDEDPETHYNLGVAFREMGLLDEAIGELQKVCQAIDHGHSFPHVMQTYTWLAQCFLDKGVPEAAIRWYEKALKLPTLDGETRMALQYELGSSCEAAGDKPTALKYFMDVYGTNIDYRDVAERIKALKS